MAKTKQEGKPTQKEMVRAALDETGWDAGPKELADAIKRLFEVNLANNIISNYKSNLKREGGKGAAVGGAARRGRKPGAEFADLEAVCGLVTRLGAAQVKELVEMAERFA